MLKNQQVVVVSQISQATNKGSLLITDLINWRMGTISLADKQPLTSSINCHS